MKTSKLFGALFIVLLLLLAGVTNAGPPDPSVDQNDQTGFADTDSVSIVSLEALSAPTACACYALPTRSAVFSEVDYVPPNTVPGKDLIVYTPVSEALHEAYLVLDINYNEKVRKRKRLYKYQDTHRRSRPKA